MVARALPEDKLFRFTRLGFYIATIVLKVIVIVLIMTIIML